MLQDSNRSIVTNPLRLLVKGMLLIIEKWYLVIYRNNRKIKKYIKSDTHEPDKRIKQINKVRINNVMSIFWANTGTIIGLLATIAGLIVTLLVTLVDNIKIDNESNILLSKHVLLFLSILISGMIMLYILPYLMRRLLYRLPSKQYAELSLNSLDQSGILTFTALDMFEICDTFVSELKIKGCLKRLRKIKGDPFNIDYYRDSQGDIKKSVEEYYFLVNRFIAKRYKSINDSMELMKVAAEKLNIKEREFCNHIMKFSPYVFEKRLENLKLAIETLRYIINSSAYLKEERESQFISAFGEIERILEDVERHGMRALKQVVIYNCTHDCIISMASVVSTSKSLQVFCRGLSDVLEMKHREANKDKSVKVNKRIIYEEFKTILHRSKAHYGMDLLILLENFYRIKFTTGRKAEIPDALYYIVHGENHENARIEFHSSRKEVFYNYEAELTNMRADLMDSKFHAMEDIYKSMKNEIEKIESSERIYFCLVGYSKVVRDALRHCSNMINNKRIKTFVFKQDSLEMLDTQMIRFELNDDKPDNNIRNSFTASDQFLFDFLNENDKIIFVAGAEIYDKSNRKLFHTNNYQKRVKKILADLMNDDKKPNPSFWLLAGDYKIFDVFPDEKSVFGSEFYCDHYDDIDMYDLGVIPDGRLKIISNC